MGVKCRAKVRPIRPPYCERCGLPFEGDVAGTFICSNCHDVKLYFTRARAAVVAKGTLMDAIHGFKYAGALWYERFLADLLIAEAAPELRGQGWDWAVPVPLHPVRERERGFNQSALLARQLGRALQISCREKILQRVKVTDTQTQLNRDKRADNMKNAFSLHKGAEVKGRRIVLVDDVLTTGATTNACAKVLRGAGAAEVCVWTVARRV